ncbi:hypothetical protein D9757_009761 [Collybiopsis confluens]|uniref:Uncharacterized protein n=1 Tax=Collybiopsis confluens TaxID=2823264 RepID=A0A8H5GYA4_9AGAR|nr:hypothetical protein D9757_009761 [Collybiopsis confluens]
MAGPLSVSSLATRRRFSHRYSQSTAPVLPSAIPLPSLCSSATSLSSFSGTPDAASSCLPTPSTAENPFEYASPKIVTDDRTDKMADQEDDIPTPKASPTRNADKSESSILPIYSGGSRSSGGASITSMTPTRPGSSSTSYSNDTDSTLTSARFRAARQKLRTSGSGYPYHPSASAPASEDDILHTLDSSNTLPQSPLVPTLFERRKRASVASSLFPSSSPSILICAPPTLAKSLVSPVSVESPSTSQGAVPRLSVKMAAVGQTTLASLGSVVVADIARPKPNRGVSASRRTPSYGDWHSASCSSFSRPHSGHVPLLSAHDAYNTSSTDRSPIVFNPLSPHVHGADSYFPTLPLSTSSPTPSTNKRRAARMLRSTLRDADAQPHFSSSSKRRRHSHSSSSSPPTTHASPALKARLESVLIADAHAEAENGHFDSSLEGSRRKGHGKDHVSARPSTSTSKSGRTRSSSRARSDTGLLGWLWNSMSDDEEDEEGEFGYGYDNVIFPFPKTAPPHVQAFSQTTRSSSSSRRPQNENDNESTPPRLRAQTQPAPSDVSRGFYSPFQGHSNARLLNGGDKTLSPSPPSPRPRHAFSLEAVPSMGDLPDMDKVDLAAEAESLGESVSVSLDFNSVSTSGFGMGTYQNQTKQKTAMNSRVQMKVQTTAQGTPAMSRSGRSKIPTPPPTPPLSKQYKMLNMQIQPPTLISASSSGSVPLSPPPVVAYGEESPRRNRRSDGRQSLDSSRPVRGSELRPSDPRRLAPQMPVAMSLSSLLPSTRTAGNGGPSTASTVPHNTSVARRRPSTSSGLPSRHVGFGSPDGANTGRTSPKFSSLPPSASAAPQSSSTSSHHFLPSPVSPSATTFSATRSSEFRSRPFYGDRKASATSLPSNPVSTAKTTGAGLSAPAPAPALASISATAPPLPPSFNAHTASMRCRQIDGYVSFAAVGVAGLEEPIAENDRDGDRYGGGDGNGAGGGGRRRGGSVGSGWKLGKLFGM